MVTTTDIPLLKGSELGFAVEAGSSSPNHLLAGIDLDIHPGEVLVILGANGAGKSTLLRLLAGVESPSAGEIRLLGERTLGWSRHRWARALAYVPQLQASFFPLTVRESLHLADLPFDQSRAWKAAIEQLVEDALESWELKPLEDRTLDQLSGGEQQRCQLARSWIQLRQPDCHLWLLDEPMSALDVHFQYVLLDHLQRARGMGKGVVMALHQLGWVRRLASHALLLKRGGMIAAGSVDEVLTVSALAELYDLTEEQASELLG